MEKEIIGFWYHTYMKFTPARGTYVAEEIIEEQVGVKVITTKTQIAKARVVAVGPDDITEFGISIPMEVKVGDVAHFISYSGDYDNEIIGGKRYYTVLRKDHRFITHE